ncbi:class I SAM-dependent methyltransferase [Halovulum sp. GXIMD14794]
MTRPQDIHATYCRQAARWDRERPKGLEIESAWLDRLTGHLPEGATVLDLGCGSGIPIAADLVRRGFKVTGVDCAEPMLDIARCSVPEARFVRADMRMLDLAERFSAILAWDSFFHLAPAYQRTMFPIFARHMLPGARLLLTTGPEAGEAEGRVGDEPVYHASLDPADYRKLMAENGLRPLLYRPEDPESDFHTVWLAEKLA